MRSTCRSRCICDSIAVRPAISCLSAVRRADAGSLLKIRPIIELVDCSGAMEATSASARRRLRSARARLNARSAERIVASLTGSLGGQAWSVGPGAHRCETLRHVQASHAELTAPAPDRAAISSTPGTQMRSSVVLYRPVRDQHEREMCRRTKADCVGPGRNAEPGRERLAKVVEDEEPDAERRGREQTALPGQRRGRHGCASQHTCASGARTAMAVREELTDAQGDDEDDHELRQAERGVPVEPSWPALIRS